MKRAICVLLLCALVLSGCEKRPEKHSESLFGLFDTVCTVTGRTSDPNMFRHAVCDAQAALERCHRLFDADNEYPDLVNLCTVNLHAAEAPVAVPRELFDLLAECKRRYRENPKENIAIGALTALWHDCIAGEGQVSPPDENEIDEALTHIDLERVILNEEDCTVFFTDDGILLDLGSVAKGYAAAFALRAADIYLEDCLVNLGGNVACTGEWRVGVQDPDSNDILKTIVLKDACAVTSGDYQRYAEVNGVRYHHILDPDTGYPSDMMRALTVVCGDPFEADYLSTALFLMRPEEALAFAETAEDTEILLITKENEIKMTGGMGKLLAGK